MPDLDLARSLMLFAASAFGNAVNAVAGGGQIVSFPAAIAAGLTPIVANTTNSASLFPGALATAWGFRREIAEHRRTVALLLVPSVVGALLGATLLRHTTARTFGLLVPWLLLGATVLIVVQDRISKRASAASPTTRRPWLAAAAQLVVAVYGGFFGVGMGLLMLAVLPIAGHPELHARVAIKSALGASINIAASSLFLAYGMIDLRAAAVMIAGSIVGGSLGGSLARRASPAILRRAISVIGFSLSAVLGWRQWLS